MHKKALKHQQFVMVDPVDQFKFYVSCLCYQYFIHSVWLALLLGRKRFCDIFFKKFRSNQSQQKKKITQQNKKILLKAKSKILSKRVKDFKNVQIWTKLTDFLQIQTSKPFTTCIKIYPMQVVSERSYTTIIPH